MGNYASQADLKTRFADDREVSFYTDTEGTGVPDTDVLDDVIESAESEINARLAMRYATPVDISGDTELARLLKRKTIDLAEFWLMGRSDHVSEAINKRVDRVYEWLEAISRGEVVLTGAATPPSATSRDPLATWTDASRTQPSSSARLWTRQSTSRL